MKGTGWITTTRYQLLTDFCLEEKTELVPTMQTTPILYPEQKGDGIRSEIQGLRAIAVIVILLFHMWGDMFLVGYLGVDCFFVVSGYLTIMWLTKEQKLKFADTNTFYFNHIRSIVPLYLFVVTLTLVACYFLTSVFEFDSVGLEALPSLFFYSNAPSTYKETHFGEESAYKFFSHTWLVSCELQFYLLVPLLILSMETLTGVNFCLSLSFIYALCFASFCRQVLSTSNAKHMTLDSRVWQFLSGFLAHFAYKAKLIDWRDKKEKNSCKLFIWLRNSIPVVFLVVLLMFPVTHLIDFQVQRLMVVFVSALIISTRQDKSILKNDILVHLGSVSYSIYLIHWPIFTMHRYLNPDMYEGGKTANHIVGSCLISISVFFGFLAEKGFKCVLKTIKNWSRLVRLLFVLYSAAGIVLFFLHRDGLTLIDLKQQNSNLTMDQRVRDTVILYESRNDGQKFTNEEALKINSEISYFEPVCHNKTSHFTTKFNDFSAYGRVCQEKGFGNKTVFVIGNSHASLSYVGIVHMFKPIAREIVLISTSGCIPGSRHHQVSEMHISYRTKCENFAKNVLKLMQQYDYKIDIIVPMYGVFNFKEFSEAETSKQQKEIQTFYNALNRIAREVVFTPTVNLIFPKHPLLKLQNKLLTNRKIDRLGDPKQKLLTFQPRIRHLLENIRCPKCLKIDWMNLWCKDEFCSAIDKKHISYFMDEHHPTMYGAMTIGKYLLDSYNNYIETKH